MQRQFVCPQSQVWHRIYQNLEAARRAHGKRSIPPPPKPLIFGGWFFSNNTEKQVRWLETLDWAHTYGFLSLIPELTMSESYYLER